METAIKELQQLFNATFAYAVDAKAEWKFGKLTYD